MLVLSGWSIQGCSFRRAAAADAVISGQARSELYIWRTLVWGEARFASHGDSAAPWEVVTAHNMRVHRIGCSEQSVLVNRSNNIPYFNIVFCLSKFVLRGGRILIMM